MRTRKRVRRRHHSESKSIGSYHDEPSPVGKFPRVEKRVMYCLACVTAFALTYAAIGIHRFSHTSSSTTSSSWSEKMDTKYSFATTSTLGDGDDLAILLSPGNLYPKVTSYDIWPNIAEPYKVAKFSVAKTPFKNVPESEIDYRWSPPR